MNNTNRTPRPDRNNRVQLAAAMIITAVGASLLIAGFIVSPAGQIHQSVLIGFGECLTFGGSLLGIDYHYKNH